MWKGETEDSWDLNEHRSPSISCCPMGDGCGVLYHPPAPPQAGIACEMFGCINFRRMPDEQWQTIFPFRKDQNYGIAWINMLFVFHELSLQCGAMLCSLSIKFSHISLLSFCSCPIAALEF